MKKSTIAVILLFLAIYSFSLLACSCSTYNKQAYHFVECQIKDIETNEMITTITLLNLETNTIFKKDFYNLKYSSFYALKNDTIYIQLTTPEL